MTHTVHPYIHRVGIIQQWKSNWFFSDKKKYREALRSEIVLRRYLEKRLKGFMVSSITTERKREHLSITIATARPGMLIGRKGDGIASLKNDIIKEFKRNDIVEPNHELNIQEIKFIETHAPLVAELIVEGLEKRLPFKHLMKQTAEKVYANNDVKGVRIILSGRLGGVEIARTEKIHFGRVPLQTMRSNIDYAHKEAVLSYGTIGVRVWVYKGEVHSNKRK